MSELFDDVTRVVAAPVSRRQALKLIAVTLGASLLARFVAPARPGRASECDPDADPMYPFPCADICCRYDYYCASTTLLNGGDDYGVCCSQATGTHLCMADGYGWCCAGNEACGVERFTCACAAGTEECGDTCCNTAAGEYCCDPNQDLCCSAGVDCCYGDSDVGTCCPDGTKCVPEYAGGYLPRPYVCCPVDQACIGQCCPDGEMCQFQLTCCPADRITPDRNGCCPSGFVYMLSIPGCCSRGKSCGDICCTAPNTLCRDGTCQECPSGQMFCFDTCCAPGTCCLGKCCGDGQTCTGECTKLETITQTIHPLNGGTLNSSDGGVSISFLGIGTEETVQYTSNAQPGHPLPEGAQLLRSFSLISPTAELRPLQARQVFYTMHVRYTEATLAAMGVESEFQLRLLWWDASSSAWVPAFYAEIDRSVEEVIVKQALQGEFVLVAGEETQEWGMVYLPLVTK